MVVPRLVRQAIAGDDMTVYGDGTQVRCFLHVDDAVAAIIALSEHEQTTGRAFNVGNPAPITVLGLAERIIQRAGSTSRITLIPYGEAYDDGFEELGERVPDITSLQALVDWKPRRDLDATLDDVIRFERAELALDAEAGTNGGQPTAAPASLRAGSP
jgi:UDP-glucose 4-epimerase